MRNFTKVLPVLVCGLLSQSVFADLPSVNPRPRMESMGGAGLGARGDRDSAMLNPAGLANVEDSKIDIFPLLLEVPFDVGLLNSFTDYNDVRTKSGATQSEKQTAFQSFLNDVAAEAAAVRINFYPSYTRKYMHFGLLVDAYADPRVRVGGVFGNQMVELGGTNGTIGVILGGGYSFLDDSLDVGATVKPLYRIAGTLRDTQSLHDVMLGLNGASGGSTPKVQDQIFGTDATGNRAYAVGVDLGVKYKIPFFQELLAPSVGLTIQDIGDTRFIGDQDMPHDIAQSISAGVAIHPDYGILRNTVALDLRNITKEEELLNKLHFGLESVIWNLLAIRAGISQGYLTGGVGVFLKIFEMDVYVASREAGHYAHIQDITTLGTRVSLGF